MSGQLLYCAAAGFEAARRLPGSDCAPPLRRLHGHGFRASVRLAPPVAYPAPFAGAEVDALRERLEARVAPLDYQLLNDHIDSPTDEALARWIRARLDGAALVGVRGAPDTGVELATGGRATVWRRYRFEAAHRLPHVRPGHKCGRMHGHGFAAVIRADAAGPEGLAGADAALLDRAWAPLHSRLHYACLNDIAGLENPTSECLAAWLWAQLRPQLPTLRWVSVHETATCGAHFDGADYRIWKDVAVDSAVRLQQAPARDPRGAVHGHSYCLRLHLAAPLDEVLGWTVDFGDVKERFTPVFERLDHQPLHEIPGVAQEGSAAIARWVRAQAAGGLPQLDRVDVYETPGCGAIHTWAAGAAPLQE